MFIVRWTERTVEADTFRGTTMLLPSGPLPLVSISIFCPLTIPDAAGRALVGRVAGGPLTDLVILRGPDVLGRFGRLFLVAGRVAVRDGGGLITRKGPPLSWDSTDWILAGRPTASSLALRLRAGGIRGIEEEATRGSRDYSSRSSSSDCQ